MHILACRGTGAGSGDRGVALADVTVDTLAADDPGQSEEVELSDTFIESEKAWTDTPHDTSEAVGPTDSTQADLEWDGPHILLDLPELLDAADNVLDLKDLDAPSEDLPVDEELPAFLGGDRPAKVVLPSNYDPSVQWPLLVLLHGYGLTGEIQDLYLGISERVDEFGFIELIPEGSLDSQGKQFWNAAPDDLGLSEVDDVGYLRGLVQEAMETFSIDAGRVVFVGHSNGGYMAYKMACEAADLVTTVAVIAGSVFGGLDNCAPELPVSVLHVHGTADDVVPYETGYVWGMLSPGAEQVVEHFQELAKCKEGRCTPSQKTTTVGSLDLRHSEKPFSNARWA